jgi:chitin synthase
MWFVASLIFMDPWHMFTCVSFYSHKLLSWDTNRHSSSNTFS